jgi:hypothetical protein
MYPQVDLDERYLMTGKTGSLRYMAPEVFFHHPRYSEYIKKMLYLCPHTAMCVFIPIYVSSYCYVCVPHTAILLLLQKEKL